MTHVPWTRRAWSRSVVLSAVAAASLTGLVAVSSPASADPGTPAWFSLGYIGHGGAPALAVDGAGDDFVAYSLQDPQTGFTGYAVYVAERAAGLGTQLGTPVAVSGLAAEDNSMYPSIAADSAGDVVVAWYDDGAIYAATRPAGTATFSDPVEVSTPGWYADPFVAHQVSVAMDAAGDAIVVWPNTGGDGTDFEHGDILVGRMRPVGSSFATASFGATQQIYNPTTDVNNLVSATSVAMGGGLAVIAYTASSVAHASTWSATSAAPSGAVNLGATSCPGASHSVFCTSPAVAVDSSGNAIAAFESNNEDSTSPNVGVITLLVVSGTNGGWSSPSPVIAGLYGNGPTGPVAVAMSPNGHAAVAWNQTTGLTNTDVTDEVAVGDSAGALGSPLALDQPTSYLGTLGVDDEGTLVTTWTGSVSSTTLDSSMLPAGTTTWQSPIIGVGPGIGSIPAVQVTQGDGNTVLTYASPVNNQVGGDAVALEGLDATGPAITDLAVPATALAGDSVPMSVDVADYAGVDPNDVTWHFGDGQTGTGFAPNHTYLGQGSYEVSVTALDAAGLTTSTNTSITVTGRVLQTATPTITGTAKVGSRLTAHPGTWTSGTSFSYHWYAAGHAISNATQATLVLAGAQYGKTVTVRVSGSQTGYATATRTSLPTAKVVAGTLSGPTPTITGTARVGSTLTAHPGVWHPGTVTLTYRWYANGTAIPQATHRTLVLTHAVQGKRITVKVTGTRTGYRTLTRTSAATRSVTG